MSRDRESRPGEGDSPRRGFDGEGWFLRARAEVRRRADGGEAIARIEEEVIGPSSLSEEAKSTLSSYGRACREDARRRNDGREAQLSHPAPPQTEDRGKELPMTGPQERSEVHADAIERLDTALDEQARATERTQSSEGTQGDLHAEVDAAAAREEVAARRAWLDYVERGH